MHIVCPHCRNPIELVEAAAAAEVLCPSCGSSFRLEGGSTVPWVAGNGARKLGRFELLDVLGTGAFGTVYRARDPQLERVVALKVPRAGNLPGGQDLDRFLREARSAAQLRHPAIVPVHEAGQADGLVYLVSDFVPGLTLADRLSGGRLTFAEAARLTAALADALHYAHGQGVVHRDVKPSNVLLDSEGNPHLTDFGLAKREAAEITVTQDGQVLGTPAYMSPEQAGGQAHAVDGRSDVYSLGVVLYQMLTGELPFRGTTRMLLHQVLHDDPRPPRSLNDAIPRDLQTVCLKAMAREPGRRYQTAAELGDDLHRFLKGEPVKARPAGRLERTVRWVRRRPAAAALLVTGLVAAAGLSAALVTWRSNAALHDLNGKLEAAAGEAEGQRQRAVAGEERARRHHYAGDVALAQLTLDNVHHSDDVKRVFDLLDRHRPGPGQEDLRGFEWYYLWRRCHLARLTLLGDPWDPGRRDRVVDSFLWVAFTPDGDLVSASLRGTIRVSDPRTGTCRKTFEVGTLDLFSQSGLALRPDGRTLVVKTGRPGKQKVSLWDLRTATERTRLWQAGAAEHVFQIALSPDGKRLGLPGVAGIALVLDAETGKEVARLNSACDVMAFGTAGGKLLAALSSTRTVALWDVGAAKQLARLSGPEDVVRALAFSPDGKALATAGVRDGLVHVWEVRTGRERARLVGHTVPVFGVAFSPDGQTLASAGGTFITGDNIYRRAEVKIWERDAWARPDAFFGSPYWALAPDGRSLALANGKMGAVLTLPTAIELWDLDAGRHRASLPGDCFVAYSPDGGTLATANRVSWPLVLPPGKKRAEQALKLWDARSGKLRASRAGITHDPLVLVDPFLLFSPDGRTLATTSSVYARIMNWSPFPDPPGGAVTLRDATTGAPRSRLPGAWGPLQFSSDGRTLLSHGEQGCVKVWEPDTGRERRTLRLPGRGVWRFVLSADGKTAALAFAKFDRRDEAVKLFDMVSGEERAALGDVRALRCFALSPDGRTAATGHGEGMLGVGWIKLWDAATGKELATLWGHRSHVVALLFSPDGKRLFSASETEAKVWDPLIGQDLLTLAGGYELQLSRDGRTLATGPGSNTDSEIRLWRAASDEEVRARRAADPQGARP